MRNPWLSCSIYYDPLEQVILHIVIPIRNEIHERGISENFMFNRSWDRGENIIIMCEPKHETDAPAIKKIIENKCRTYFKLNPSPSKKIELPINDWFLPFPNNHVHIQNNFLFDIMETGGLQAASLAQDLLCQSTNIVLDFIEQSGEEWGTESAFGIALQFHLVLMVAFNPNLENLAHFYNYFFSNILTMIDGGEDEENKKELMIGLQENFNDQKDALSGFTDYIISTLLEKEEFEDEWLNHWFNHCSNISQQLKTLQDNGEFFAPEQFSYDQRIPVPEKTQELWHVLEYYLRAINSQLGVSNASEISLIYSLKESIHSLAPIS